MAETWRTSRSWRIKGFLVEKALGSSPYQRLEEGRSVDSIIESFLGTVHSVDSPRLGTKRTHCLFDFISNRETLHEFARFCRALPSISLLSKGMPWVASMAFCCMPLALSAQEGSENSESSKEQAESAALPEATPEAVKDQMRDFWPGFLDAEEGVIHFHVPLSDWLPQMEQSQRAKILAALFALKSSRSEQKWKDSWKILKEVLAQDIQQVPVARSLALGAAKGGDPQLGETVLRETLEIQPQSPLAWYQLADYMAIYSSDQPEKVQESLNLLKEGFHRFPKQAGFIDRMVRIHLVRGEREQAVEAFALAQETPDQPNEFFIDLGRTLMRIYPLNQSSSQEANLEKLNAYYERIVALKPQEDQLAKAVVDFYLFTGQLQQAVTLAEKRQEIAQQPEGKHYWLKRLVEYYGGLRDESGRLGALKRLQEAGNQDLDILREIAVSLQNSGDAPAATQQWLQVVSHRDSTPQDVERLFKSMTTLDRELIDKLEKIVQERFADNGLIKSRIALQLRGIQEFARSSALFSEAENLLKRSNPEALNSYFYYHFGISLERSGKLEDAIEKLRQSIKLLGKDPEKMEAQIKNYLGYLLTDLDRNLEEAGKLIQRAVELEPDDMAFLDSLAWWHYRKGEFEEAKKHMDRVLANEQSDAELLYHAAAIYLEAGDREAALKFIDNALETQPDYPEALQIKEKIQRGTD